MGLIKGSKVAKLAGCKAAETRKINKAKLNKKSTYNCSKKNQFRDMVVSELYSHNCSWDNILSLETSEWLFNKSIDASHTHYQIDEKEYNKMIDSLPEDTEVIFGDILDAAHSNKRFKGVWLDYMNTFDSNEKSIYKLVDSDALSNCSVFALSFSTRSPGKNKFRTVQLDRILTSIDEIFHISHATERYHCWKRGAVFPYNDTSPMWGIILTRSTVNKNIAYIDRDSLSIDGSVTVYYAKNDLNEIVENPYYKNKYGILDGVSKYNISNANILNSLSDIPKEYIQIQEESGIQNFKGHDYYNISCSKLDAFIGKYEGILIRGCDDNFKFTKKYKKYTLIPNVDILDIFGWNFLS